MDILPLGPEEINEAVVQEENRIIWRIKTCHVAIIPLCTSPSSSLGPHSTNSAMKTVVDLSLNEIGHGNVVVNALVAVVFPQRGDNLRISECLAASKDLVIALAEDAIASVAAIEVRYKFAACVLAPSLAATILHEILSLERVVACSEFGASRFRAKPAILDTKLCV
jgi:hypothetical protein